VELKYQHLLGKPHVFGGPDCFSLGIDFFYDNFGIKIRNYARPQNWDADKVDLINNAWEREGFEPVHNWDLRKLRPGDVLVMAVGASTANHFAIYVGENKIIHHLIYQLSKEEVLRDRWRNSTLYVLRHPDVPDLRPNLQTVNLQDIINARYRPEPAA
jgi:cell wall-associated NlpC family hydrolase